MPWDWVFAGVSTAGMVASGYFMLKTRRGAAERSCRSEAAPAAQAEKGVNA